MKKREVIVCLLLDQSGFPRFVEFRILETIQWLNEMLHQFCHDTVYLFNSHIFLIIFLSYFEATIHLIILMLITKHFYVFNTSNWFEKMFWDELFFDFSHFKYIFYFCFIFLIVVLFSLHLPFIQIFFFAFRARNYTNIFI